MKNIVITGSTRGIGFGLAQQFLQRGCSVALNGRSEARVTQTVARLGQDYDAARIVGQPGDVALPETHRALWETAVSRFGTVDIWINNAGLSHDTLPLWEIPSATIRTTIEINVLGLLYGSQIAMQEMGKQGHGQIYNMEGFGSGGRTRAGMSVYGTSKAAVAYASKALIKEAKGTAVQVCTLQPGMVMTDLVLDRFKEKPEELEKVKGIFNIIADTPENVTRWLAEKILATRKHGTHLAYLPTYKLIGRFLSAPFSKRDLFA